MSKQIKVRSLHPGMGQAVAERTVLRKIPIYEMQGDELVETGTRLETWADVAERVAEGNARLCKDTGEYWPEKATLERHIANGTILMSGRHLQHGDSTQPTRPLEVFSNCLDRDTKILTLEYGPIAIAKIVGEVVTIKARDGVWREAKVKSYGNQILYKYTFAPRTGPVSTFPLEVTATEGHRWFLFDGSETTALKVGDVLEPAVFNDGEDAEAVRHGLIFGDGPSHKDLPFCSDPSYITGFIHGWWLADGAKTFNDGKPDRIVISTAREDAVDWLKDYAAFAGYVIAGISKHDRKEGDGSYANGKTLYSVRLSRGISRRVASVELVGTDEVFCVEEPVTHGFVLANGLLTGNCSTSATSFTLFMLLLNGSGVGRSYDDDMMVVNWNYAPNLRVVMDSSHKDFDWSQDESVRDARHKYKGENVIWHEVEDSREGWAKAIEIWETLAYQKVYVAHTLVLDFSKVRPRGAPIGGMQGRPSSGPKPLMNALMKVATIKGSGMKPWRQALYVDHYLAECVLVGGARRAARMATKHWKDKDILDFIQVKRPIEYDGMTMDEVIDYRKTSNPFSYLWSSNNSVAVDAEFWEGVASKKGKAWKVLNAICEAAYGDGTGEPGIINVDKLNRNDEGLGDLSAGDFVGSTRYAVEPDTKLLLSRLAGIVKNKDYYMIVNPCGEIPLSMLGSYCVIADIVPFHADTLDEAEEAFRAATRALIRVNTMDNLYSKETKRTNRIGVGVTGIHEFAWKFFKVGFRDLINPDFNDEPGSKGEAAASFWLAMQRFSNAVKDEAEKYSKKLGINTPHTSTTVKPSGSVSKLFGVTEGWHLPAHAHYMRWVQFRSDDPLVRTYKDLGYQTKELQTYSGTTIVGFPTQPAIGGLGMGDALVMATEATPEEQYKWLRLGEKYWIGDERGGQISYTLKYDPAVVSFEHFRDMLIKHQSQVKCCSVLPVTDSSAYEYLPESTITKTEYEALMREIADSKVTEDVAFEHIDCATGACPVDFNAGEK